jgi:integrase
VAKAVDDWAAEALDGLADKTVRSHVDLLRPVTMLIGNVPQRDLTAQDVRRTLSNLAQTRSTRTMASTHNVLVRAIRHAEANDRVGRNVASLVKPPQGKTGRPSRAMTAAEAAALLSAAKDHPRLGAYVILSLTTGIRTAVARLGTPLDASHVRRDFRALCKKAGIEGIWAPRELRHTFVSVMSVSGVAVEEIARLAGHSSSRTTEVIYRHELRPVITTGADVMDQIFV